MRSWRQSNDSYANCDKAAQQYRDWMAAQAIIGEGVTHCTAGSELCKRLLLVTYTRRLRAIIGAVPAWVDEDILTER